MSNFKSPRNKSMLLGIVDEVIRQKFQITLNEEFGHIFDDIMDYTYSRFGKKPKELTNEVYLKNVNKICMDEAIKYISDNIVYFPKITNAQRNNKTMVISDETPTRQSISDYSNQPGFKIPIPENLPVVPYNGSYNGPQQNLFKGTDDLLKQMQFDRNGSFNQMPNQINFQLPNQNKTEDALMLAIEQRKKDFPSMNTPDYKPPSPDTPIPTNVNMSGNSTLMSILLKTPIAVQNPNIVPSLINEIMQMQHLVDLMNKDPVAFQQQVTNSGFLQMIITQIKNKSDPKMKPMSLNETDNTTLGTIGTPGSIINSSDVNSVNSDFAKMVGLYRSGEMGTSNPDTSQMDFHIPPSEQLVNNVLPNLDQIYLINYELSLDFRTDLENTDNNKSQYSLKFIKFGNISKVKLLSCVIPENDLLMNEPYIYIKIEELGGRCYTSNHDITLGKLILSENKNGYLHYVPDKNSCVQNFSQPTSLQKFTISFLNFNGKYINLKEISIMKSLKLKKQNKLKFITLYKHKLSKGETIDIHIYRAREIDSYEVQVETIIDDNTFMVDNVFETLSEHMVILRHSINCSFTFKLYEINWNLLTKKNLQNAQLIRLSQLIDDRRREVLNPPIDDTEIIKYTKSRINLPSFQK